MIVLIFKKTIVFVQSARETYGCTRRISLPVTWRSEIRARAGPPGPAPAHAGAHFFAFRGGFGVCLTERALKRTNTNLHFRSLRCNVAGDAC